MNLLKLPSAIFIIVFLILSETSLAQVDSSTGQQLDSLFSKYAELGIFNGAILIAEDNEIHLKKGYGYANYTWNIKNDVDTKFQLASLSKHFTANCIMQLKERELINLDDNLSMHLSEFEGSDVGNLTIHQLLSHTSGIKRDIFELAEDSQVHQIESDIFTILKESELQFEPGSKYSYGNAGYYLLAKIVERKMQIPFGEALQELIFDPAEMSNSGFHNKSIIVENLARGYEVMIDERVNGLLADPSVDMGASSVYSTVEDIFKYELAYQGNEMLSDASKSLMETPVMSNSGYGWKSNLVGKDSEGNNLYMSFHNGDYGGFATQYLRYGPDKFTIVMLSNQDELPRTELFNQIVTIVNGGTPRPIIKNKHNQIYRAVINEDVETAIELANDLKATGTNYPHPFRVNSLGNMLFNVGRSEDAKKIHQLNISLYPENFIGYAAIGLILKAEGDLDGAKDLFKKILEFDPKNTYAISFLADLEN